MIRRKKEEKEEKTRRKLSRRSKEKKVSHGAANCAHIWATMYKEVKWDITFVRGCGRAKRVARYEMALMECDNAEMPREGEKRVSASIFIHPSSSPVAPLNPLITIAFNKVSTRIFPYRDDRRSKGCARRRILLVTFDKG